VDQEVSEAIDLIYLVLVGSFNLSPGKAWKNQANEEGNTYL